jgi:nucleotide-binding universal stress UspA family protein
MASRAMGTAAVNFPSAAPGPAMRPVLVCLDRSPASEICLAHALSHAKAFGSSLTLLHVMEPPHESGGSHTSDALGWAIACQEAQAYLERRRMEASQALGRPVDVRLEQGSPAERIVGVARELDAELIILGRHGENGTAVWGLGATVQQVLAQARGSVFVAHSVSAVDAAIVYPRRILVPLDRSFRSESALPTAARLASAYGAELLLAHVVQEPLPNAVLLAAEDVDLGRKLASRLESGAARYLDRLRDRLSHQVAAVRTLVIRHANERQGLREVAQSEHVDLIVLSAHGSAADEASGFGSVTADLLTHATVPVLVLQDLPEGEALRHGAEERLSPPPRSWYPPEGV